MVCHFLGKIALRSTFVIYLKVDEENTMQPQERGRCETNKRLDLLAECFVDGVRTADGCL